MRRISAINTTGEILPAGGAFRINAVFGTTSLQEVGYNAVKPDTVSRFYHINGPVATLPGQTFTVNHTSPIVRALVDWDDPAVGFGVQVGPSSDTFAMSTKGIGFYVQGNEGEDGLTPVRQQPHDDVPLVELLEDLGPAGTGIEDNPPNATAGIFGRDDQGALFLSQNTMILINRGRDIEYGQGTRGYPKLIAGELHFMPIECDQGSSSDSGISLFESARV